MKGDLEAELAAVASACGVCDHDWVEDFDVAGEDRVRFLNGYVTCDLSPLEPGRGAYGFFTDAQGRILADAVFGAGAQALRVAVPAGRSRPLIEHLSRYVLADRVTLEPREGVDRLLVVGAGAETLVSDLLEGETLEPWAWAAASIGGHRVEIQRDRPLGAPVFVLRLASAEAAAVAGELHSRGAAPIGADTVEALRILAGVPRYGADFDASRFPQETGLEDAISYSKGCYLGQEVVARIHYRGHVNYTLRTLRGEGETLPAAGTILELAGADVGRLGSVTRSPATGEIVGLAILHRKAAAAGTEVSTAGGPPLRVD